MTRSVRDIAWAGGLFEGEGCFSVPSKNGSSRARPTVLLTSTDRDVVDRFCDALGVGSVRGPFRHKNKPHHKPFFTWRVGTFEGMQAVVAMLWPFLGERRKGKAYALLTYLRDRPKKFEDGAYCNARLIPSDIQEIRRLRGEVPQSELAKKFGVSQGTISEIQLGKSWTHIATDVPPADLTQRGETHFGAKLTADNVREIRSLAGTMPQHRIAKMFGINQANVSQIVRRKTWAHVVEATV